MLSLTPQCKLAIHILHQFLKSHGCQDILLSLLTFYKTSRTLTTLSKRSLKRLALESDLQEVLKQAGEESVNGRGDIVSLSTPIPTTTGLCKPLTDNAPDSLAPILASLTDKVNHTSGLAGCTGSLHLQMAAVVCNVPMMDVLRLVAASSSAPPASTSLSLSTIPPSLPPSIHSSPPPLVAASVLSRMNQVGGLSSPCSNKNVKIIFRWLVHTPAYSQG